MSVRPVWSESSLPAWRNLGSLATHWVQSEDSDQTGRMPSLIWVSAGRTLILFVLSCRGSSVPRKECAKYGYFRITQNIEIYTNVICYSTEYITAFLYKWSYIIQAAWSSIHSQCRMYLKRKCTLNADGSGHYFGQINRSQNSIDWFLSFVTEKDNLIIWLLNFRPSTRQPRTSLPGIDCHNKTYRLPVMLLISSPL